MLTHLDLCSGIGGFKLAAQWAGFETVGFSEVDPYCCALLAEKWPGIRNYGDLRRADFAGLRGRVDVLSAGVPCQPASLAGKRRGAGDDRWLWEAVLDVVGGVQPAWCIFENPVGILSLGEFGGVLLRLGEIGYAVRAFSVPANALGAKHRRQRVFIVANADSERHVSAWSAGAEESLRRQSADADSEAVADRACELLNGSGNTGTGGWLESTNRGEAVADTDRAGLEELQSCEQRQCAALKRSGWPYGFRLTEPALCGRADGVRGRVHRLKALGNAVVPQQAYPFFEAIAQVERSFR